MPTLIYTTGFEHGVLSASGGGICSDITGSPTVQGTVKRSGSYALQINPSAASEYIVIDISGSPTCLVGRFYLYIDSLHASGVPEIFRIITADGESWQWILLNDGEIYCQVNGGGDTSGGVLSEDTWYRIDFRADCSTTTGTMDWQIDGSAKTQVSSACTQSTFANIRLGNVTATTWTLQFDDIGLSATSGDYPLGAGEVIGLSPNADGTHNAGTNVMEDQDGNDIGAVTAYNLLDEVPMNSDTDYVRQAVDGTGNYAEVQFADLPVANQVNGAMGLLAYSAGAASANHGKCVSKDSEATETTIYDGDMSESSLFYKSAIITPPSGGWDQSEVNALRMRMGYSTDATPDPYWHSVMFEVDYVPGETPPTAFIPRVIFI